MAKPTPTRVTKPAEEGYILIAVVFMLALLIIAMAVAAPQVRKALQRDRELETMHRGKQYARAIKLYYKKFGRYPPNVDALVNTNQVRFLRRKYVDPTTGKEDWKAIPVGQQKAQTLGFFGQPIGGPAAGAAGSLTGNALPGSTGAGAGIGAGQSPQGSAGGGLFNSTDPSSAGQTAAPIASPLAPGTLTGQPVAATGTTGAGATDANGNPTTGSAFGQTNGATLGGLGIIGFSPNSPKESIIVYKKKKHYNEWEFTYDPLADQMMMQGGNTGTIGQPAGSSGFGGPGMGNGTGSGSSFGSGSGFGTGSSFGNPGGTTTPAPAPTPTQPQQQ